jgi:hypothetical protein
MLYFKVGPAGDGIFLREEPEGSDRRKFFGARDLFGAIRLRAHHEGTRHVAVASQGSFSERQEREVAALVHLLRESGFSVT